MKNNKSLPERIRESMRRNEQEVLDYLRARIKQGEPVYSLALFGTSWYHAFWRLDRAGKVKYARRGKFVGYYVPVRYARPVTNVN